MALEMTLLALPYDIRHQIYEHLFPPGQQIYIQVLGQTLRSITPDKYKLPTGLLLTCRAINEEASDYLYNRYLFNIIGTKQHCLPAYKGFLGTVKKHARHEVHVNAFSNGTHSSTMCISIHSGEGRTAVLKRRERGEPKTIAELKEEVAESSRPLRQRGSTPSLAFTPLGLKAVYACAALLVLLLAWEGHSPGNLFWPAVGFLLIWVLAVNVSITL
jgi:hypothetical protein